MQKQLLWMALQIRQASSFRGSPCRPQWEEADGSFPLEPVNSLPSFQANLQKYAIRHLLDLAMFLWAASMPEGINVFPHNGKPLSKTGWPKYKLRLASLT